MPAARLAGLRRPLRVLGPDGADLPGSPLDPDAEERAAAASPARGRRAASRCAGRASGDDDPLLHAAAAAHPARAAGHRAAGPRRQVAVVVPAYRGHDTTRRCLDAVLATACRRARR